LIHEQIVPVSLIVKVSFQKCLLLSAVFRVTHAFRITVLSLGVVSVKVSHSSFAKCSLDALRSLWWWGLFLSWLNVKLTALEE
jgi:hypothetical protein